ncbi:MAG TPA: archease [Gemmataceae bacterium]|jgi:SHS2 domain-containing protein|nr:archease [Gemmataceae bacterium]
MHETFDHTADVGLRIKAAGLDQLFAEAAEALFSLLIEDLAAVQPKQSFEIKLEAEDLEYLLFDWLKELLYRFDAEHWVFSQFSVQVEDGKLEATVAGEPLDWARHVPNHEVKAITYHGLRVERQADGWLAEVIVDI